MRAIVLIPFLLLCLSAKAQFGQDDDVMLVNGLRKLEPYQNRLKGDFSLDARRTLFQSKWIAVSGIKAGLQYRRIHRLGVGIYFLNTRAFDSDFDLDLDVDQVEYRFDYSTLYYERALYFDRKWETGATLHLGGGAITIFYQDPANPNERLMLDPVQFSTIELSAYGEYSILYWLGVGAGGGYRSVFGINSDLQKEFSSPIFVVNVQLKIVKLVKSFFNESVKDEY